MSLAPFGPGAVCWEFRLDVDVGVWGWGGVWGTFKVILISPQCFFFFNKGFVVITVEHYVFWRVFVAKPMSWDFRVFC